MMTEWSLQQHGVIALEELKAAIRPTTVLVTVMHANNEVGTVQPLAQISALCRAQTPPVLLHTDASQSVGKVPVSLCAGTTCWSIAYGLHGIDTNSHSGQCE